MWSFLEESLRERISEKQRWKALLPFPLPVGTERRYQAFLTCGLTSLSWVLAFMSSKVQEAIKIFPGFRKEPLNFKLKILLSTVNQNEPWLQQMPLQFSFSFLFLGGWYKEREKEREKLKQTSCWVRSWRMQRSLRILRLWSESKSRVMFNQLSHLVGNLNYLIINSSALCSLSLSFFNL